MARFHLGFWNYTPLSRYQDARCVQDWADAGMTLPLSPTYGEGDDMALLRTILDEAHARGIRVILYDNTLTWRNLTREGEAAYRARFAAAAAGIGAHPAVFGFFVGDEPDAPEFDDALRACRIQKQIAPALSPFLNLLPWFDWIGERMGTDALAPYLDRVVAEGHADILAYDCYCQMWEGETGWHDYFNNLREYMEACARSGAWFINTVLSMGHYYYRCPSKDDMRWQMNTSIAHGAKGVYWFFMHLTTIIDNYRNPPIDRNDRRTQEFEWLASVQNELHDHCGEYVAGLTLKGSWHVGKAYGGFSLFSPTGNMLSVEAERGVALILSRFEDARGRTCWMIVNNNPWQSTLARVTLASGTRVTRCSLNAEFVPIDTANDPFGRREGADAVNITQWLAPGQMALLREE